MASCRLDIGIWGGDAMHGVGNDCSPFQVSLAVTGLLLLSEPVAALVIDFVWLDKPITLDAMAWGRRDHVGDLFGVFSKKTV